MTNVNLTDAQLSAVTSESRNICVLAGAGSGKTGVLVERFLRLVTEDMRSGASNSAISPAEILVITFTDRATREMKQRIVRDLLARGRSELRRELESASISTIHSFCARLLRENALDAGLDPRFAIADEAESRLIMRQSIETCVSSAFTAAKAEDVFELLDGIIATDRKSYGLQVLERLYAEIDRQIHTMRGSGVSVEDLDRLLSSGLVRSAEVPVRLSLIPLVKDLFAFVSNIQTSLETAPTIVRAAWRGLFPILSPHSVMNIDLAALESYLKQTKTNAESAIKQSLNVRDSAVSVIDVCDRSLRVMNALPGRSALAASACSTFVYLLCESWLAYNQAMRRRSLVDHEDLQLESVRLLESDLELRDAICNRFRHIMIDEMQDTNPIQIRLIRLLHPGLPDDSSGIKDTNVSRNSLFVVGDPRQSIYSFRNAAPDIFDRLVETFSSNDESDAVVIHLDQSFRAVPQLVDMINRVASAILPPRLAPRLIASRKPSNSSSSEDPCLELMLSKDAMRRDYVGIEADAIAKRILELIGERAESSPGDEDVLTSASGFGDIAILLRGTTEIATYQEALASHGIPCVTGGGGRGYYARQEVQEVLALLTLLFDPHNDAALLTVLSSPLCNADLNSVYRLAMLARVPQPFIAHPAPRYPLYTALTSLIESPAVSLQVRERVGHLLETILTLQPLRDDISVAEMIERVMSVSGYRDYLASLPDGALKAANLRKLTQIALSMPEIGLAQFTEFAANMQSIEAREGDASLIEEVSGAVRLLTIHAAKGLEFPIVFLPDLSRAQIIPETALFVSDPEHGAIGTRIGGEDATWRAIVGRRDQQLKEESARLLYVAMTRACDKLILCGNAGRNRGYNWMDQILPILGISAAPPRRTIVSLQSGGEILVSPMLGPQP